MGNQTSRRNQSSDAVFIVHDFMPVAPLTVRTCIDELVDWTREATLLVNDMQSAGVNVLSTMGGNTNKDPVYFIPMVLTRDTEADVLIQKDIPRFPKDCTFERTAFYHQDVLICVQQVDCQRFSTLSGLSFCMYLKLLRRLFHLVELDDSLSFVQTCPETTVAHNDKDECGICMARPQDTVLPCLHGVCSSCEAQWVETHKDCPFCRQQYKNPHRRKRDQWQLEKWSKEDVEKDLVNMQVQVQSFWKQHASSSVGVKEIERYARLEKSFTETIVDNDFVLLH